ncbi:hypothetical protein Tco_0288153, partial [Tanacetum coccineum]
TADRNDIIWLMASMGLSPCLNTRTVRPDFGMSSDKFDKETGSSDGLQPKQADLSCAHVLNELHLHEIRVLPSKHEVDQY